MVRNINIRRTIVACALAALAVVVVPGTASAAAPPISFACQYYSIGGPYTVGGGTITFDTNAAQNRTVGVARFRTGSNFANYPEHYSIQEIGGGARQVTGTFVTGNDPLFSGINTSWLYISGTAIYAPNGALTGFTGGSQDICERLGLLPTS
jgi:hypothetical protein